MRIATYNVNSVNARLPVLRRAGRPPCPGRRHVNSVNARLPVLRRWLAETQPDVACLQELKAAQEKFPADAIKEAGYHAIWHGQKAWNGVAILARAGEPVETGRGLPPCLATNNVSDPSSLVLHQVDEDVADRPKSFTGCAGQLLPRVRAADRHEVRRERPERFGDQGW
jgi:exonuclease III